MLFPEDGGDMFLLAVRKIHAFTTHKTTGAIQQPFLDVYTNCLWIPEYVLVPISGVVSGCQVIAFWLASCARFEVFKVVDIEVLWRFVLLQPESGI
jgi:hypothetical protein